ACVANSGIAIRNQHFLAGPSFDWTICQGASVVLAVGGGDTYSWSTGETTQAITVSPTETTVYTVDGTDVYGCSMSDEITVYQYDPIQVASISVIPESAPSANNGSIEVTGVTGGVAGGYTYSLFFEAALVASNGTGLFTLLPPGDYYLVVNDNAPCEFSTTVTVPPATVCTAAETPTIIQYDPIICPGEDLFLTVNGSALNDNTDWYWYEGSCGGTPIETGANLYIPLATNTTYYVRGEGGCVQTGACASIAITPLSPPNISFNVSATDITCNGAEDGTISILNATGGAPGVDGYTYTVSDGESYFSNHTGLFTGLWSSSYFVLVTDTSVCGLQDTVDYFINEPDPIAMTINLAANSCYGQDVTGFIAVTGGTLPYTGDGAFNLGALAPTDSVLGFLVSDANGCQQVDSVVFSQPSALVLDGVTDSTIVCLEFSTTGELTLTPSGGTAPYTITGDATTGLVD
ncbi:MAG TPA: SprB repeat-containing protein, partial [Bacteroidia bacterium]|nr:SprB repeat-containing protein [Bacteroidia bacterium]